MKLPDTLALSEEEYCQALHMSDKSLRRKFPLDNRDGDRLCIEFSTSLYIMSNGDIIPCAKYRKPIANIFEKSLAYVWKVHEEWHIIQNYRWLDAKECQSCGYKAYCVRCGAMAYIVGRDFLENSPETCILAQIRAKNYKGEKKYNE